MKTTKRTFGKLLALALVFLFALTAVVSVSAVNEDPNTADLKITIHNNEGLPSMSATQFGVYQLFKGTPYREGDVSGTAEWDAKEWNNWTLADIEWGASVTDDGEALLAALTELDPETETWVGTTNPFASATTAADVAAVLEAHKDNKFMQGFADFLMKNGDLTDLNLTGTLAGAGATQTLTYDLTANGPGYYIFQDKSSSATSRVVSEYIIAVMGTQDIDLKASIPTVDKEIIKDTEGTKTDVKGDAAGISDYVQFKLTGTLPHNYGDFDTYKYVFHDTLSKGLDYVESDDAHPLTVKVYSNLDALKEDPGVTGGTTVSTDYTVTVTGDDVSGPETLEVLFANLKALKDDDGNPLVTAESVIVVTYWAQVNEDAVIGSAGNPNIVYLEYSNDPNHDGTGRTQEKIVYVYAFGLDLTKVGSDNTAEGLPDAGFVLKRGNDYATFKAQWLLTVTKTKDGEDPVKDQTFYDSEEAANTAAAAAKEAADTEGGETVETDISAVRRLIGWTSADSTPKTTDGVKELIDEYKDGTATIEDLKDYLLMSDANGAIPDIYGLDEGSYALEEIIVPDGYNTPEKDFDIAIGATYDGDGHLTSVTYTHDGKTVTYKTSYDPGDPDYADGTDLAARFSSGLLKDTIVNQKAPFLPFTGGIGTTIFYVLGTLLIAGAVTYLVIATKKRKSAE